MAKNTMTLTDNRNGKSFEYNIIDGTRGPSVVDISTFYKDSGMFTYDPGYTSTASCESKHSRCSLAYIFPIIMLS